MTLLRIFRSQLDRLRAFYRSDLPRATRSVVCVLWTLLLVATSGSSDEVVTVDSRGRSRSRAGTIVDVKGEELTLRESNRQSVIPLSEVLRMDADWTSAHRQADKWYQQQQYEQALADYRRAFQEESRRWVKRKILARVVRCQENTDHVEDACRNFSRLTSDDPRTPYFDVIPLQWQNRAPSASLSQLVLPWLTDQRSDRQLLAASWLLNSPHAEAAYQKLRALGRDPWPPIAKLAVAQLWRRELVTLKSARMDWWQQFVAETPVELRAGGYFLLGQSFAKLGDQQQAVLAWMRIPMQYRHQVQLSNEALFRSGEAWQQLGQIAAARRCFQRLVDNQAAQAAAAQQRLKDLP